MPTFMRVNRKVEPVEKPMATLSLYSHPADMAWGATELWKAAGEYAKLRRDIDRTWRKHHKVTKCHGCLNERFASALNARAAKDFIYKLDNGLKIEAEPLGPNGELPL